MPQGYGGYGANNTNLGRGTARGQAGRMYAGGSPNFDERTGAYRNYLGGWRDRTIPGGRRPPGGGLPPPPVAPAQRAGFFGGGPEGYRLRQAYQAARAGGNPMDPRMLRGKIREVRNPRPLPPGRTGPDAPDFPVPGRGGGRGDWPKNPGPMPPNMPSRKTPTQRGGPMAPSPYGRTGPFIPEGTKRTNPNRRSPMEPGPYGPTGPFIPEQRALLQMLMGMGGRM